MQTQVVVNNTDISEYIVADSYNVNQEQESESWKDGNKREHRVIVTHKVNGSFQVACSNKRRSIPLTDFLALWNNAVVNEVATIGVRVLNTGAFEAIECYFEIKNVQHDLSADGTFVDVLEITITER